MISIHSTIRISELTKLLENKIDEVCTLEPKEVNKMKIKLCRCGNSRLSIAKEKILIDLPLQLALRKGEGIFSVEVSGRIDLNLKLSYEINDGIVFDCKTVLVSHHWIEGPILEIGKLDVPIEKVADIVINYYKDDLLLQINQQMTQSVNSSLSRILDTKTLNKIINSQLPLGLIANIIIQELLLEAPEVIEEEIIIRALVKPIIFLYSNDLNQDLGNQTIKFLWIEKATDNTLGYIKSKISYQFIINFVEEQIKGLEIGGEKADIRNFKLNRNEDTFVLDATLFSPIKGFVHSSFKLKYNESIGYLEISNFTCKVTPDSFIYKLGAPIINKIITSRVASLFPLAINKIINLEISKQLNKRITTDQYKLQTHLSYTNLDELSFNESTLELKLRYENAKFSMEYTTVEI